MRILYLMHIDWGWIKQRPHFFAEHLASQHDVRIAFRINPSRSRLTDNVSEVRRQPLLPIPRRLGLWSERLDSLLQKVWLSVITGNFRPDLIWLTFPTLYSYLPAHLLNIPTIYDCMDDAAGFYNKTALAKRIIGHEARLVQAASHILCSSQTLCNRLDERYRVAEKISLIRNGCPDSLPERVADVDESTKSTATGDGMLDMAYFGSIAEWFDFSAVMRLLDDFPNLRIHLIGPADSAVPRHGRLVHHGVVDRDRLQHYVQHFHAFIMPFKLSPLIESVDPVKLYEYIAFGKETISVFYPEIGRFEPFLHFYSSFEELHKLVHELCSGTLKSKLQKDKVVQFLSDNTWSQRTRLIDTVLLNLNSDSYRMLM